MKDCNDTAGIIETRIAFKPFVSGVIEERVTKNDIDIAFCERLG